MQRQNLKFDRLEQNENHADQSLPKVYCRKKKKMNEWNIKREKKRKKKNNHQGKKNSRRLKLQDPQQSGRFAVIE